jgi:CubicO group peptidase (beta-lactamase class C family)
LRARCQYSNTNTVLLGHIAQQCDGGKLLDVIMRDRLFTPLGLKNTLFPVIASNAIPEPYSRGYMYGNNVLTMGTPPALPDRCEPVVGLGGRRGYLHRQRSCDLGAGIGRRHVAERRLASPAARQRVAD